MERVILGRRNESMKKLVHKTQAVVSTKIFSLYVW